jgi:glycosyltransferase involved in cell wall biosynthesis
MACGVPCVTTAINGIPELIEHGKTGWLTIAGNPDSLAEQIASLLAEPGLRESIATAARAKVRQDFDLVRNVAALSHLHTALQA